MQEARCMIWCVSQLMQWICQDTAPSWSEPSFKQDLDIIHHLRARPLLRSRAFHLQWIPQYCVYLSDFRVQVRVPWFILPFCFFAFSAPDVCSFYTLLPHHLMSVHPMHSSCTTFNSPDLHSLCPFMHIHDRTMQLACSFINARQGKFIYFACCSFIAPVHANIQDGVESFILLLIHCTCSCVYIRQGGFIYFACCSFIAPVHAYIHDGMDSFILLLIHCTCSCVNARQGGFIYFACCSFVAPVHAYIHDGVGSFILLLIHCTCSCVYIRQGGFINFSCCSFIAPVHAYL